MAKSELELAYDKVTLAQTTNLSAAEDAVETFITSISNIIDGSPAPSNDPVRQMLNHFLMQAEGFKTFNIANLKTNFGLTTPTA